MDPQKKIWKGDPGHKYKLTSQNLQSSDLRSPFRFNDPCSLCTSGEYNGTMIRLPLRNQPSDLSKKLYSIENLKSLLDALKNDAEILLLFLRYIEQIEVYYISDSGDITKVFSVEAEKASREFIRNAKSKFFQEIAHYHANAECSVTFPHIKYMVNFYIHDVKLSKQKYCQWLVIHQVGSANREIMEVSDEVTSLPWIGIAVPLTSNCPSRLFCFLPLPDSEDVNPPLPVCVHGTFGLNKDRRHLKWMTSDMKNDNGALWNKLLLSKMLPSCYESCLSTLKDDCNFEEFYSYWPSAYIVNKTNWKDVSEALFSCLIHSQLFWSQNGGWVKLQSSVLVVPEVGVFPQVVINVLIACDKIVVRFADKVWEAVKYIKAYPFTTITPLLVRQILKKNPTSYVSINRTDKIELLKYCLDDDDDDAYNDLYGLVLLPVVSSTFITFNESDAKDKVYICDAEFVESKLLVAKENILVSLEVEDRFLHDQLKILAESAFTQLRVLKLETIAAIFKDLSLFDDGYCQWKPGIKEFDKHWLESFWKWIQKHPLSHFISIPLVPHSYSQTSEAFRIVPLLLKGCSQVIKCNQVEIHNSELISAIGKLGCCVSCSEDFMFFNHLELDDYVHTLSPSTVLSLSSRHTYFADVVFTNKEADVLREFLFQHELALEDEQKSVLCSLRIFRVLKTSVLQSLVSARCILEGINSTILIAGPQCPSNYLPYIPKSPLVLCCSDTVVSRVISTLPDMCRKFEKSEIISHFILPALDRNEYKRDDVIKITSMLLEPQEYYSLVNQIDDDLFFHKFQSLRFLPTDENGLLCSPSETFDPTDSILEGLYNGYNVFPVHPFTNKYFDILKQLGMKVSTSLTTLDIIMVAQFICKQNVDKIVEVKRATKLLDFLSAPTGSKLLNQYYNNRPVDQTLHSLQWLPVITTPPKGYPKCLGWKGSSGSQFVSAQSLHACSSPEEHKKLPNLIGSQIKILQYEGTLSVKLIASLNIPQTVPVDAMILQLLDLITHRSEIEIAKFKSILSQLYVYLQRAAQNNSTSQYWQQLSQSEVVQVSDNQFVLPSVVACSFDEKCMTVGKLEPYWYILPSDLQQYRSLFCFVGAKDKITVHEVLFVLTKMNTTGNVTIRDLPLVKEILQWLCRNFTSGELLKMHNNIFVPVDSKVDSKLVLKPAKEVNFLNEDLEWLKGDKEALADIAKDHFLVHPSISYDMIYKLQLDPLNTSIANSEEFGFEQAGQSEKLTTRLNRILREYKDTSVIQELLQNADDAGATEVAIYYDSREHNSNHLFFPGMANSYGPALLFYNNAQFSEEDFENIRKIAGETKINKPLKIGKFGVGFCSVYNITDVPSFVSGEHLVVFDPTLQCLRKEIKSEFNPGIKINFIKHRAFKKSNQLIPYKGLCEFDPKRNFHGTLFRFPLRKDKSAICNKVYTASQILSMIKAVQSKSSKLLMFLRNIKKLSFHKSDGDKFAKEFEVVVRKDSTPYNRSCKIYVATSVCQPSVEKWLIATSSQQTSSSDRKDIPSTASVSVKLNDDISQKLCVANVRGECFCFLPLNIETGLPVHVSSNFAVMTNRRGIWKADNDNAATKESKWNKLLMETVITEAYINLLLCLKEMQRCGAIVNYKFHCLWPVDVREINPWKLLVTKFYDSVASNSHTLFLSAITDTWIALEKCIFISSTILQVTATFDETLHSSLLQVANVLQLPVIDLPNVFWNKLLGKSDFNTRVMKEEQFIQLFYQDGTLAMVPVGDKTAIVTASLITLANKKHCKSMPELMKCTKCIPCSPDGMVFKRPQDIISPKSNLSKLYSPEDGMFPDDAFLKQNSIIYLPLSDLGMMKMLPWEMIIDRAKHMQRWYSWNPTLACTNLTILIDCIQSNLSADISCPSEIKAELQRVAFLPAMLEPNDYPIEWKGSSCTLLPGPNLTKRLTHQINTAYACGSQVAIFDTKLFPATDQIIDILGINKKLDDVNVAKHFAKLLDWFHVNKDKGPNLLKTAKQITKEVYKYWGKQLNDKNNQFSLEPLSCIKNRPCIWDGTQYLHPCYVSFKWTTNGPIFYKVPSDLEESLYPILRFLGVTDEFSVEVLLEALSQVKHMFGENTVPPEYQDVIRLILPKLNKTIPDGTQVFLPDRQFVLQNSEDLKYNDAPWCSLENEYNYCHDCVERVIAINLGVDPVKSVLLEDLEITGDEDEEEFGQEEELTQRLSNILRDYPYDITILKELLQNADDAGATELCVILDKRYHNNEKVISEQWKDLQGPALLFWNNSSFSDDDLVGIQKIGLGNKRDDASTIGQYGIGFNVVYHFTDCPSFISNQKLCILDPHHHYIAHNKRKKAGKMYKHISKIWRDFPDMKSSYLQNDLRHFPELKKGGSLFRLPLRLTQNMAQHSEISQEIINLQKLEKDLNDWVSKAAEALLFLRCVKDVKLYVISNSSTDSFFRLYPVKLQIEVKSSKGEEKLVKKTDNAKLVFFPMTLSCKGEDVDWLVVQGEGNVHKPELNWNLLKPSNMECQPCHGIAAPVIAEKFSGKPFCFLPLPGETHLPVHIHGHFVLHSDRQSIWMNSGNGREWNQHLLEAIAVSYAHFLINCINKNKGPMLKRTLTQLLDSFYKLFPNTELCSTEPWLTLCIHVYETLSLLNAPILAKIVRYDLPVSGVLLDSFSFDNEFCAVKWFNMHLPDEADECFFHPKRLGGDIKNVLLCIGMNLIDTPWSLHEQVNKVKTIVPLPSVSKESVTKYYRRFSKQIYNGNFLPCVISSTKFMTVKNFAIFLKFLMTEDHKFTERLESIEEFFSLGLLVTADEYLHSLSDGPSILSSESWKVFSNSKHYFIHEGLQQFYHPDSKYILKFNSDKSSHFTCIATILASNLPSTWNGAKKASLSDMDFQQFQDVSKCITNDGSFRVHSEKLLNQFSLLPANDSMVYSTLSDIKPMGSSARFFSRTRSKYDNDDDQVKSLLTKLHIPLLEHEILDDSLDDIGIDLPNMFNPEDILNNLFLVKNDVFVFRYLSKAEMDCLFNILKLISYSSDINRNHLSQLPVFTTIDGHLVSLASASEIWIWNSKYVCTAGIDQWINCVPEDVIFLDPSAPWGCLKDVSKTLKMHNINKYEIYCKFIFPYFYILNPNLQRDHLKFIKDNIYLGCREAMEQPNNNKKVTEFVNALKSLECIMDNSGTLCRIGSFCDHNEPVFSAFSSECSFLPVDLRGEEWKDFLKYFGLKVAPSSKEYISFCKHLPSSGDIRKIKHGSFVLLKALFKKPLFGGVSIYKDIHSPECLKEVSQIPIAILEENKSLHCIKEQKMGEHIVQHGTSTITLSKLLGSSPTSNQYLVWTVLPLVKLHTDFLHRPPPVLADRMEQLGIVLHPSLENVLSNVENLSMSHFASFSRFIRHSGNTFPESSLLPEIVCTMLEYLQKDLKKHGDFNRACSRLAPRLSKLKFLPVKLPTSTFKEYALVQPMQVLCVEPIEVAPYYPILHPLIEEANSVMSFLLNVGVCRSIKLSHIQHILESVKNLIGDNEIDVNNKHIVVRATKQLILLLQQTENSTEVIKSQLQNLYLLSEDNRLKECSTLFVNDVVTSQPFPLPAGYAYLNWLSNDGVEHWKIEKLLQFLPKELGLRSLKSSLVYDMTDCTPAENIFPHISIVKDILLSSEFKKAVEKFASCSIHGPTPTIVSDILNRFQANLTVQFLSSVKVQPKVSIGESVTPLDSILDKQFFLEKSLDNCCTLSLRNDQDLYPRTAFQKLAKQLCSKLRLKSTDCFTVTDDDELPELTSFVSDILQCKSISEVLQTVNSNLPGAVIIELETSTTINENPSLGDNIPEIFLERLDQSIFNIFNPEEWVGYEIEHEHIVYAQILHEVIQDQISDGTVQDNMQRMMQRRFLIALGHGKQIEVSVLEIYKLLLNKENSKNTEFSSDSAMDVYDGPSSSEQTTQFKEPKYTGGKKGIRDAVKAAWALPKDQRNKAIKRLYLQCHPDKNPDNPNATAEFQYLQQVIENMERGIPVDETDGHDTPAYNSAWSSRFHQWNQTASSHRRFRSRNSGMSAGGMPGGWNIPNPHKDFDEAKRWIKQAEYDYAALRVLKTASVSHDKVCAATCFMCHEVAEKSLKAGMYAKCGLGQVSLNNHNLVLPTHQLVQLGCSVNISDAELLENFYLDTRFPNRYPYPTVPGERFVSDTAKQAFEAATRIYEAMMQVTENGN